MARLTLRVVACTVVGFVAQVTLVLLAILGVLTPDRMSALTQDVANRMLDADVGVGRVDLSLRGSYPFMDITIDSLVVCSRQIRAARDSMPQLPQWGDTLVTFERLHGGINFLQLLDGRIRLNDLEITSPQVNVLIVNDSLNNFEIIYPSNSTDNSIPDIRIDRFRLVRPKPVRYYNLVDQMHLEVRVADAEFDNSMGDGGPSVYSMAFDSDIVSPLFQVLGQDVVHVGLNGTVEWSHTDPYVLQLSDFDFSIFRVAGRLNASIDFNDRLLLRSVDFALEPMSVNELLQVVHDSPLTHGRWPEHIDTDAAITLSGKLLRPYVVGTATLPYAVVDVDIAPCHIRYQGWDLRQLQLQSSVEVNGGWLDDIVVDVRRLTASGPVGSIDVHGSVRQMQHDALIDAAVSGHVDMRRLAALCGWDSGSWRGQGRIDASIVCRPSMFTARDFHRLRIAGDIDLDNLYYLRDDTLSMVATDHLHGRFGTNRADSLLNATIDLDRGQMLVSGLRIGVDALRFRAYADTLGARTDTTVLIPMRGRLQAGRFDLFTISDTLGMATTGIDGRLLLRRMVSDSHVQPQMVMDVGIDTVSAGYNDMRMVLDNSRLHCDMVMQPHPTAPAEANIAPHRSGGPHPYLSPEAVYAAARAIRDRGHRPGYHRVHTVEGVGDTEVVDWNPSRMVRDLLTQWSLHGTMTSPTGRLAATFMPLDNTMTGLSSTFSNDTVTFNVRNWRIGHSDMQIAGIVTDVGDGLMTMSADSPIRANLRVTSGVIDADQLASAVVGMPRHLGIGARVTASPDTMPLLPTNVDARIALDARRVVYAGMGLRDLVGTVLLHDGTLNINQLHAASDVGSLDLSAMYMARRRQNVNVGIGMRVHRFNISEFLRLVPVLDRVSPMIHSFEGIVDAQIAATTRVDERMHIDMPSLQASVRIVGDSLRFMDQETYHRVGRWLLFRDDDGNRIDHLTAEMVIDSGMVRVYPFVVNFNRYRLGVEGYNDLSLDCHYHVAVLRSPIPFRFGVNLSGPYDHLRIRLGGAHFEADTVVTRQPAVSGMRQDLLRQIQGVFDRGDADSDFGVIGH